MAVEMQVQGHLGGYMSGEIGDPATYYPELWSWLVEGPLAVRSVLDLGCGEGHALRYFRGLGCDVLGIDGVEQDDPDIFKHDFEARAKLPIPASRKFDLVWTCEFVEHVEEKFAHRLANPLLRGRVVLMTHAFPGQQGHHHVNCRPQDYWLGYMAAIGLEYSPGMTVKTRELAGKNEDQYNHFVRSGLAFRGR